MTAAGSLRPLPRCLRPRQGGGDRTLLGLLCVKSPCCRRTVDDRGIPGGRRTRTTTDRSKRGATRLGRGSVWNPLEDRPVTTKRPPLTSTVTASINRPRPTWPAQTAVDGRCDCPRHLCDDLCLDGEDWPCRVVQAYHAGRAELERVTPSSSVQPFDLDKIRQAKRRLFAALIVSSHLARPAVYQRA